MAAHYTPNDFDNSIKDFITSITIGNFFFEDEDFIKYFSDKSLYIKHMTWQDCSDKRITFYTVYETQPIHLFRIDYKTTEKFSIFSSFETLEDLSEALNFFKKEINLFLLSKNKRILEERQKEKERERKAINAFKQLII